MIPLFIATKNQLVKIPYKTLSFIGMLGASWTLMKSFEKIPTGHIGFKNLFGHVYDQQYESGYTFINPFAQMIKLNLRKKIAHNEVSVSSNEGLGIEVSIDVVNRLDKEVAKDIYINTGVDYEKVLLNPQINSCVREIISGYNAKDLYNDKARMEVKEKILTNLTKMVIRGIVIEDVLINRIILPKNLSISIENKLQAEQEMEKMDFTLSKERKEAERKQIEAEGIKAFQNIVSQGISRELLEWKGITATEEFARSPNAKIVIIGNTKNGLPMVFSDNKN
jgi:regulator of protease activity HflC (stomatin/prohibitin superfamily)